MATLAHLPCWWPDSFGCARLAWLALAGTRPEPARPAAAGSPGKRGRTGRELNQGLAAWRCAPAVRRKRGIAKPGRHGRHLAFSTSGQPGGNPRPGKLHSRGKTWQVKLVRLRKIQRDRRSIERSARPYVRAYHGEWLIWIFRTLRLRPDYRFDRSGNVFECVEHGESSFVRRYASTCPSARGLHPFLPSRI